MRILRFDLTAYGPFMDTSLDLSEGREGFHIIYGPNEAEKSCALRGLTPFFTASPFKPMKTFSMKTRTSD